MRRMRLGGTTIARTQYVGPPRIDTELRVVFFPYQNSPTTWDAATLTSTVVELSGATAIDGGGALPLVRPDPSGHLAEALGPGVDVFCCHDVLHAGWHGAPSAIDLADARLVVRQGQLLISSHHVAVLEPFTPLFKLWAVRDE